MKKKRNGYWEKYNKKFSNFNVKKIMNFLVDVAKEVGEPFQKRF